MGIGEDILMVIVMATDMVIEMATEIDIPGTIMTTDTIEMVIGEADTATFPIGGIFVHTGITTDVTELNRLCIFLENILAHRE
jgi:hypothetical protein